jgi:hypothetical protein
MPPVPHSLAGQYAVVRAGNYTSNTQVFPPMAAALLTAARTGGLQGMAATATSATFEVNYHDFSPEAKAAFQAAVDVWSVLISTPVPIKVEAHWKALEDGVLGSARAETFIRDFAPAPAIKANTWYPIALANKLNGADLASTDPDIQANFNKNFDNWHFGIDGMTPPDKYDLMSVVLHELGHGLGFAGSMNVMGALGSWGFGTGFPIIYDRFVENVLGDSLLNVEIFPNNSAALKGQLTSERLVFDGPKARAANAGSPPKLYAPITFEPGSSYSHLNEATFTAGSSSSLMTPQIGRGESIHAPGPIALGLLSDIGW